MGEHDEHEHELERASPWSIDANFKKKLLVVTIFARARNLNSKEQINFIANRKKNYRKELAKQDHHPVLTWTTFMTTMRLRGREAIMSRREPIVNSREQIPGPSSQTEKGGKADK